MRLLIVALLAFEFGLFLTGVGLYKLGKRPLLSTTLASEAFFSGLTFGLLGAILLIRTWRRSAPAARRNMQLIIGGNVLMLLIGAAALEIALRLAGTAMASGMALGALRLPPTWDEVRAENRRLLFDAFGHGGGEDSYLVADPLLGWTAGPNRQSRDGLYFSSAEGVRSPGPDMSFASHPFRQRIALVGDSYTFSVDVSWRDSWAHYLQQRLGPDVQVLNFGIDGYGIDQAYLRYQRDVRPWHPDLVLFGLIQHDVARTLVVYPFISFGWGLPFAKPRFIATADGLSLLNAPLVSADAILERAHVSDLPFVEYDLGYQQSDWRWRLDHAPRVIRLFQALFRRWPVPDARVSDEAAIEISGKILQRFRHEAVDAGSAALIVYFPSRGSGDFGDRATSERNIAREMLAAYAPDFLDLTSCVREVPAAERLVPGKSHYAGPANAAVAACVGAALSEIDPAYSR
jgi:hypothetical protein